MQADFGVDRDLTQGDVALARGKCDRPLERGRPARGEELLRIGPNASRPGDSQLDVQMAVRAAADTAGNGMRFGGVGDLSGLGLGFHGGPGLRCGSDGDEISVSDGNHATPSHRNPPVMHCEMLLRIENADLFLST